MDLEWPSQQESHLTKTGKMYYIALTAITNTCSAPGKRRVSGQWLNKEGFLTQQMTYKY